MDSAKLNQVADKLDGLTGRLDSIDRARPPSTKRLWIR